MTFSLVLILAISTLRLSGMHGVRGAQYATLETHIQPDSVYDGSRLSREYRFGVNDNNTNSFTLYFRMEMSLDAICSFSTGRRVRFRLERGHTFQMDKTLTPVFRRGGGHLFTLQFIRDPSAPGGFTEHVGHVSLRAPALTNNYTFNVIKTRSNVPSEQTVDLVRSKRRDRGPPQWVSLNEFRGETLIWLRPLTSMYGVEAVALIGGSDYFKGNEYLQLTNYQSAQYVLHVPGLVVGGPHFTDDKSGIPMEVRSLFRYSMRDAAWLIWNYKTRRPMAASISGEVYWQDRAPAITADIPGMIFEVSPNV